MRKLASRFTALFAVSAEQWQHVESLAVEDAVIQSVWTAFVKMPHGQWLIESL